MSNVFFAFFQTLNQHLQNYPQHTLQLYFQEVESFRCSRCAQCCSLPWGIGVSQDYYQRWEPIFNQDPDPRFHDVFELSQLQDLSFNFAHLRKQSGSFRCVLLDEDNLCLAQKKYGFEAKPLGCQKYPVLTSRSAPQIQITHLMQSCRSAPLYLLQEDDIVYKLIPDSEAGTVGFSENFSLHALADIYFSRETFLLWVGLQLDVLVYPSARNSPIENMRSFIPLFQRLMLSYRQLTVTPQLLRQVYVLHFEDLARHVPSMPLRTLRLVEWYLQAMPRTQNSAQIQAFYARILAGEITWPALTVQEHQLLNSFLRAYLARALLSNYSWLTRHLNVVQYHVLLASILCLIQLQTLADSQLSGQPLSAETIRAVLNLIEGQLLQSKSWLMSQGFALLSDQESLTQLELLLNLDLTIRPEPIKAFRW